jgi:hypothetical protein
MATDATAPQNADDLNFELRQNINDAYAFIEGAKSIQMFSTLTFEDLMDAQITTLTGVDGTGATVDSASRPCPLRRIDKLEQSIQATVAQIKKLPPEAFQIRDQTNSVNTPPEGDDV